MFTRCSWRSHRGGVCKTRTVTSYERLCAAVAPTVSQIARRAVEVRAVGRYGMVSISLNAIFAVGLR